MKTFVKDWMCFAVFSVSYIQAWSSVWSFLEREGLFWTQALLPTWSEEKQLQRRSSPALAGQVGGDWCNFRADAVRRESSSWLWAGHPINWDLMEQNGGEERAGYGTHLSLPPAMQGTMVWTPLLCTPSQWSEACDIASQSKLSFP